MSTLLRDVFACALGCAALGCSPSASRGTETGACDAAAHVEENIRPTAASAANVQAIFARSCALGGCHLSAPGAGDLVLSFSSPDGLRSLVGMPSQENPSINLVTAGNPDGSWLVRKVYGDLCSDSCKPGVGCGAAMPTGAPLDADDRAAIVAWVASL